MESMINHVALVAAAVLLVTPAQAMRSKGVIPQEVADNAVKLFYLPGIMVDGLPVMVEEWRGWDGRRWSPLGRRAGPRFRR